MEDGLMGEFGEVRIGDAERQVAVDALNAHREAGRLDPTEFEDRQVAASRARTWAEVVPLFADLPEPHPVGMARGLSAVPAPPPKAPILDAPASLSTEPGRSPGVFEGRMPLRHRDTVMALTPFAAVVLFFVTGLWIWFLAIPVMGILLYGPEGDQRRKRGRGRCGGH